MKSEIKQRMFFKDLSSKSLANSNLINSKMLNNVVADCGLYVNPNAVKFFRIALSNFEKVLLRAGKKPKSREVQTLKTKLLLDIARS